MGACGPQQCLIGALKAEAGLRWPLFLETNVHSVILIFRFILHLKDEGPPLFAFSCDGVRGNR